MLDDDGNRFSFPSLFHLIIRSDFSTWVSSLLPLHPQVILISENQCFFFPTSVCTCDEGNHGEGGNVSGLTGSPENYFIFISVLKMSRLIL